MIPLSAAVEIKKIVIKINLMKNHDQISMDGI